MRAEQIRPTDLCDSVEVKVVSHTITIGAPAVLNGKEGRRELAALYCALLDMRVIREDWLKIAKDPGALPQIALDGDGWSDERPPRWPDPEFPQHLHRISNPVTSR